MRFSRVFERLDLPFDFRSNVQIPVGDYKNNQMSADFVSSSKRPFTVSARIMWREFYSGKLINWSGGFGFVPNQHISIKVKYDRNEIDLPQGRLNTDLIEFRLNIAFTTHLFLNTLIQYNSETNDLSTNLRLNFIHTPGSDLFVVYNENRGQQGQRFF